MRGSKNWVGHKLRHATVAAFALNGDFHAIRRGHHRAIAHSHLSVRHPRRVVQRVKRIYRKARK